MTLPAIELLETATKIETRLRTGKPSPQRRLRTGKLELAAADKIEDRQAIASAEIENRQARAGCRERWRLLIGQKLNGKRT